MRIEDAISAAREDAPEWTAERAARVLAGARAKKESRARRDRVMRRGGAVVVGAAILVVALLKTAAGHEDDARFAHAGEDTIAARAMDDAGLARD